MKKFVLTLIMIGSCYALMAQSKSVDQLYQKYKGNSDMFHLELSGSFLDLAKGMDFNLGLEEAEMLAKSIDKIKIYRLPKKIQQSTNEFEQVQKSLQKEKYELLIEAGEKNNTVMIYAKDEKVIKDIVVMVKESGGDFTLLELMGEFDSNAIAKASKWQ